jgi:hypothetical protein
MKQLAPPSAQIRSRDSDAVLVDWGRRFEGREGVASWDSTDNTGVQSHMEVVGSKPSRRGYMVTVRVAGNGFNGTGHIDFVLEGDRISEVVIE